MKSFQDYINRCYTDSQNNLNVEIQYLEVDENEEYLQYSYSDLSNSEHRYFPKGKVIPVIVPDYCTGSDYSGGTVTKANFKWFEQWLEENENSSDLGVYLLYGDYSSYGIAISIDPAHMKTRSDELNQELLNVLSGLEDYPCISDELLSELEMEIEEEYWEDTRTDLIDNLENKFNVEINDENDDSNICELYRYLCDESATYPIFEIGCLLHIDFDRLINHCELSDLDDHKINYTNEDIED